MHPFLCFRCLHISNSAEGLHCPHCDGDGSGTVMAVNSYSAIPESGDASPVYYVTVEDASTQVSEEDLGPEEPIREASTQTSDDDLPVDGSHGFENCLASDGPSQSQASQDSDHYTIANQNGITHTNTNEGEIPNQSYDICNAATLLEVMDYNPSTSKQTNVCEQSTLGENEIAANGMAQQDTKTSNKLNTYRCANCKRYFLKERTFKAHKEGYCGNSRKPYKCGECGEIFRDLSNLLLHRRVHTGEKPFKCTHCDYASAWLHGLKIHLAKHTNNPPSISSISRKNSSVNKYFQEKMVTSKTVKQKNPRSSKKLKIMRCKKCRRYIFKGSKFICSCPK